jgi:hypothetical protein
LFHAFGLVELFVTERFKQVMTESISADLKFVKAEDFFKDVRGNKSEPLPF